MERLMNMMSGLNIASKSSLKQFCLIATQCNVDDAERLYNVLIKDMDDLPMFDPVRPTVMQNVKSTAVDIFSFFKENKEEIAQGLDFIKSAFSKGTIQAPAAPPTSLPPIN